MLKPFLHENFIFFNEILFPVGLLSNRQDFTWGWGSYIWGSELRIYNFKMASWICHINVNIPFGRETVSCLNGVQLFNANHISYTGTIFSPEKAYLYIWVSLYKFCSFYYSHIRKSELIWRLNKSHSIFSHIQ